MTQQEALDWLVGTRWYQKEGGTTVEESRVFKQNLIHRVQSLYEKNGVNLLLAQDQALHDVYMTSQIQEKTLKLSLAQRQTILDQARGQIRAGYTQRRQELGLSIGGE
jgi:membrane-associated PAP2 superfamily phosphatase